MIVALSLGPSGSHQDYEPLKLLEDEILEHAGGWKRFRRDVPNLIRLAIDEVIDTERTGRFTVDELENIEKAYISNKVKMLVFYYLQFDRGKVLDALVNGAEVGIGSTSGSHWLIPLEAVRNPYILVRHDEKTARCSIGLTIVKPSAVVRGLARNRPYVTLVRPQIPVRWMLRNEPYPMNPWEDAHANLGNL